MELRCDYYYYNSLYTHTPFSKSKCLTTKLIALAYRLSLENKFVVRKTSKLINTILDYLCCFEPRTLSRRRREYFEKKTSTMRKMLYIECKKITLLSY